MQVVNNNIASEIINTLSYADVFDYPLSGQQVFKYLIGKTKSQAKIDEALLDLVSDGFLSYQKGRYYLNGNNKYLIYKNRHMESQKKWRIAFNVSKMLSKIPSVKLIGISGSLSMNNADKKDDIDLFIVTCANMLWITRFIVTAMLMMNKLKRGKDDKFGVNLVCPNMFVAEDRLKMDQNLFVAHEIAQLKVLWNKDNTYQKFLTHNLWALRYMPNAFEIKNHEARIKNQKNMSNSILEILLKGIDQAFYICQYLYMRGRITTEKISNNRASFHPKDKTHFVLNLHNKRRSNYLKYLSEKGKNSLKIDGVVTPGY